MALTLTIGAFTCAGIIASVFLCPQIKVGRVTLGLYWVISVIGALTMMLTGRIAVSEVLDGICASGSINPVKIIVLFISMTFISVFLDELGFFASMANIAVLHSQGSQKRLFVLLYITVALLTVFTSNDIIILTFTPFICCFAKNAHIDPLPYLVSEFVAANTWSMALIIGNPTNVYLASFAGVDFVSYMRIMVLPAVLSGAVAFAVLFLLFRRSLSEEAHPVPTSSSVSDRPLLVIGLSHLLLCTVLLVISSYVGIEMYIITLAFALSLVAFTCVRCAVGGIKPRILASSLKRAPWELVPFVISMFVVVLALGKSGVSEMAAGIICSEGAVATAFNAGFSSALFANLINNIPMSVLYSSLLTYVPDNLCQYVLFSSVAGSNIGAFITPVGALAGIMWSSILKHHGVSFSFYDFVRYGVAVAIPALATAVVGICVML